MFTYRRHLERRGWHRPWPLRVVLVVLGVVVTLSGWFMWTLEQEKGGWEGSGLGHFVVGDDEQTGRVVVWGEEGEILYEARRSEDVDAWIESQRHRDFTIPAFVIAGGVLLTVVGVAPSLRVKVEPSERRSADVLT